MSVTAATDNRVITVTATAHCPIQFRTRSMTDIRLLSNTFS